MVRFAFTLIELIFAIVIVGIAVLSLPMINQALLKGMENNIAQEAIFASATELAQATTYYWDKNSVQGNTTLSRVINIANDCNSFTKLRPGHINEPLHRRCLNALTLKAAQTDDTNIPNLNNAAGVKHLYITKGGGIVTTGDVRGYKNIYDINITVTKGSNFNPHDTTSDENLKKIAATVIDSDGKTITKFIIFSANIGEIDYYKRSYQ